MFHVTNGIRQGGILSPYLFNIVMDDLSKRLNETKVGCQAGGILITHLTYADDMVLIAPSARALQKLLDICGNFARKMISTYKFEHVLSVCVCVCVCVCNVLVVRKLLLHY